MLPCHRPVPSYTHNGHAQPFLGAEERTFEVIHGGTAAWPWGVFAIPMWCQGHTVSAALEAVAGTPFPEGKTCPCFMGISGSIPRPAFPSRHTQITIPGFFPSPLHFHQPGCISQKTTTPSPAYHCHLACQTVCAQLNLAFLVSALCPSTLHTELH